MNKPRRKRTYFQQHLGVAHSLLRLSFRLSLSLSLSAAVERVNRSFIAKWILWKRSRSHWGNGISLSRCAKAERGGLGDLKIRLVENVNFQVKDGRVPN